MIQFNLLPDVKLDFLKAQKLKRSVVGIAIIAGGASLTLLILLFLVVDVFQKTHISSLNGKIKEDYGKIQSVPDLNKILTIQNQLNSLSCTKDELSAGKKPCLHDKKPVATRLFRYLKQVVPDNVSIAELTVDFDAKTMTFTGTSNSLATVNKFVDTLKFTGYVQSSRANWTIGTSYKTNDVVSDGGSSYVSLSDHTAASDNEPGVGNNWKNVWKEIPAISYEGNWTKGTSYKTNDVVSDGGSSYVSLSDHTSGSDTEPGAGSNWKSSWSEVPNAFSSVVLSSFARDSKIAKYTITLNFAPSIFDNSQNVSLIVPKIITTRSETENPTQLFKNLPQPATSDTTNQQGTQ